MDVDAGAEQVNVQDGNAISPDELRKIIAVVQHQLNNPLAALLAEAQLLEMEPTLGAEQRAATVRITELTRRVIALVRDIDVSMHDQRQQLVGEPAERAARPPGNGS